MPVITAQTTFQGYRRENGRVGVRNHVIVLPVDDSVTLSDSSAGVDAVPVETNGAIEVGKAVSEDKDNWTPYNTTVFTKDGVVSNILRIWVP